MDSLSDLNIDPIEYDRIRQLLPKGIVISEALEILGPPDQVFLPSEMKCKTNRAMLDFLKGYCFWRPFKSFDVIVYELPNGQIFYVIPEKPPEYVQALREHERGADRD